MPRRWKHRPQGSTWGDHGDDDQLGAVNLLTREKVLQGVAEVREGRTFCLSLPLDYPGGSALNPRRSPPRLFATVYGKRDAPRQRYCSALADESPALTDVGCDDAALLSLQYSTQWDSLAHVGGRFDADGDGADESVFYNGFRAGDDIRPAVENAAAEPWARFEGPRAEALGVELLAEHGLQGRAVLVDLHAHFGRERRPVGYDDLMVVLERDGVAVEPGDFLCLHTGFADLLLEQKKAAPPDLLHASCAGLDGRDERLLRWISEARIPAIVADNYAVELFPLESKLTTPHALLPLHEHCLFKNGIPLGELWHLGELAKWLRAHGRSRFLLTAPPLRLPGAVGSPVTPLATV